MPSPKFLVIVKETLKSEAEFTVIAFVPKVTEPSNKTCGIHPTTVFELLICLFQPVTLNFGEAIPVLNTGTTFYAMNKANGSEEEFDSKEQRTQFITLGSHEKPRDVKNASKKADALKMLAMLYSQNKEVEKAKNTYAEARKLAPNDQEIKTGEFQLYYNSGYALLADEEKIVNEINSSRDNPKKYDELVAKRKEMFAKAIPDFEKAYALDSTNESLKTILKMSYEITGQVEKAKTIK